MGLNKQDLEGRGIFAPKSLLSVTGGVAVDVRQYNAIGNPDSFEYYVNDVSGTKKTRTGVIWIHPEVTSITFTANDIFEVM